MAAAAAAKSLQSCPTLFDPIDGCPPGSLVPGILQARTLEWAAVAFSNAWKWKGKLKSTSWQIEGEKVKLVADFLFLGSKITADGDCSHEIRRWLLLGRKAMTNLDSVLRRRDMTLLTKVHIVKAVVFLVVMYGCESWMVKKEGSRKIDAFKLWCWRRLLKVPWTARRSNQSVLKEINPEYFNPKYSLEGLMLKLQYFGHLMWRAD